MFPTKTDEGRAEHASLLALTNEAMLIRAEQMSGYPRPPELMTNIEFRAFLKVAELCEAQGFMYKQRLEDMIRVGLHLKASN